MYCVFQLTTTVKHILTILTTCIYVCIYIRANFIKSCILARYSFNI